MGALSGDHVIELRLLGGLDLRRSDGRELDSILTQPKRVAVLAFLAAWTLAQRSKADGDFARTAQLARRAAALVPDDEETLRRLVALLDDLGDRVGAVQVYEEFARRVAVAYQVEPAAETKALIALVRSREAASAPVSRPAPASFTAPPAAALPPAPATTEAAPRRLTRPGRRWVVGTIALTLLGA